MTVAVRLTGVTVTHHRGRQAPVAALTDVNLTVMAGERVAVVGRSGAGKSSLARLLVAMDVPTSGTVEVLGQRLDGASRTEIVALRRRVHMIFQDPYDSLHPGLSVGAAVAEPLGIAGTPRAKRRPLVEHALEAVGLDGGTGMSERYPSSLSGGQRQRVAMARALVARPELVVADEPASMLDASLRTTIIDLLLRQHAQQGSALIFITHDLAVARHIADTVVVMAEGRIVERGDIQELLDDPQHPESRQLIRAARVLHATSRAGRGEPTPP